MMNTWGAEFFASPSDAHAFGPGGAWQSIRIRPAASASRSAKRSRTPATHSDTNYALGSVLNHVLLHQTRSGIEAKKQMAMAGEDPDVIIGCFGGGSNFGGIALPYIQDKLKGSPVRLMAVEPAACPTLTRGVYTYDFGDIAKLTPLMKMYTLGHDFVPAAPCGRAALSRRVAAGERSGQERFHRGPGVHAIACVRGGGDVRPVRGHSAAPESAHAIRAAIDEAIVARNEGKPRVILFCLSGHGHFDLSSYDAYLSGRLQDYEHPGAEIAEAMETVPQ